jgi:hypothetical protein
LLLSDARDRVQAIKSAKAIATATSAKTPPSAMA